MRGKKLLAAFLLGVGLCFVPVLGHGEVKEWVFEVKASRMEFLFLDAKVNYMMHNPTSFLEIDFLYGIDASLPTAMELPKHVDAKRKILIMVQDNRGAFAYRSPATLLDQFRKILEAIYPFVEHLATEMNNDIVATFYTREEIPSHYFSQGELLGYFYRGEYHLWEK